MTLYRKRKDAAETVDKPVFCLIGANGLGKSTFLNSIVYALTGAVPDPDRGFQSAGEYFTEAGRPERTKDYFGGRLSETDRKLATVTVLLTWSDAEIEVTRPLAEGVGLARLCVRNGSTESVYNGADAEATYRALITKTVGVGDFAQFVFLVHFVLTFDEARHLVMWDDRCTMHRGTEFDDLRWRRDMHRATVSDIANTCEQAAGQNIAAL